MFPLFKFTLSNTIEGSLVISEPGGWDDAKFKLERNKEFHSLVEFYDQPLTFYGDDISHDGGIQYIRNIEQTQGLDAQISLLIEISHDEGDTYETAYEGILSIETAKEIDFYKLEMGVIRNDFWQKFINRKITPVDLSASVDLDGNAITPISPITLRLPSQTIRAVFRSEGVNDTDDFYDQTYWFDSGTNQQVGVISLPKVITKSIQDVFTYTSSAIEGEPLEVFNTSGALVYFYSRPFESLVAKYKGTYSFNIKIVLSSSDRPDLFITSGFYRDQFSLRYAKNNDLFNATDYTKTNYGTDGIDGYTVYDLQVNNLSLEQGDAFRFWMYSGIDEYALIVVGTNTLPVSFVEISADTVFPESETESFILKDAAESILSKCIGQDNVITSDYLDSCSGLYAIMKGLNIRGYSLADKPIQMSFDDWWKGAEPILNLGLGYEPTSPETLRIEPKSYFYNKTVSINLDFVNNIERSYDIDSVFKLIEIGYNKWSAESDSGIDDPQTKHSYNTLFKTVGKEIKILSQFIAASLAIEQTRRNRVEEGKDWRLDDDVMIIALKDTSPYEPELDENFSDVTGLLNAETRYNIRLSVARNFERWKDYFNGCLQWYLTDEYKFASGEGNYDMTSTLFSDDCEAIGTSPEDSLSEKQDIAITSDYLFKPIVYKFEHPLTWDDYKTISDNPTRAIGISRSDSGHVACFINVLEYEITRGKGTFELYLADNDYL